MADEAETLPTLTSNVEGLTLSIEKKEGDVQSRIKWGHQYTYENTYYEVTITGAPDSIDYPPNEVLATILVAALTPDNSVEAAISTGFVAYHNTLENIKLEREEWHGERSLMLEGTAEGGVFAFGKGIDTEVQQALHALAHEKQQRLMKTARKQHFKIKPL